MNDCKNCFENIFFYELFITDEIYFIFAISSWKSNLALCVIHILVLSNHVFIYTINFSFSDSPSGILYVIYSLIFVGVLNKETF